LKALEVSQEAARAHPDDVELLQVRGAAYAATGDTGNALTNYKRIVQLLPESAEAHFRLAAIHAVLNDGPAARKELEETLKRDSKHLKAKITLVRLNIAEEKHDEALRLARELQKEHPEATEGAIVEAEALNRQSKQSEAVKVLEVAYQTHPDSGKVMIALSQMRWALGDREGSLQLVKDWRDSHPNDPAPSRYLGLAYLSLGREQEATDAFEQALKLVPGDPAVLNNLAIVTGKKDPQKALGYAEKAYKLQPKNSLIADTLGWLLVQQGDAERGLKLLQTAFNQNPKHLEIHYHYAAALAKSGAKEQARGELQRLLDSGKKFPQEQEARDLLKGL
jgi:putative PEP-CTERM system TPR-repeat lipoprotein